MTGIITSSSSSSSPSSSLLLFSVFFLLASSTSSPPHSAEEDEHVGGRESCSTCPYFLNTPTSVTTSWGRPVNLTCGVRNIGDGQVSWIRWRDLHVLTTGNFTFTSEGRFKALHVPGSPFWTLHLEAPHIEDSGSYKCQVSTRPMISRRFTLSVVVAEAVIEGGDRVYMKAGSDINVSCLVVGAVNPRTPVTWYHTPLSPPHTSYAAPASSVGVERINSGGRGGVQVVTDKRAGTSWLLVTRATRKDAGNYTCAPDLAKPASVIIHVLDEEVPAAMQHDVQPGVSGGPGCHPPFPVILLVLLWCCSNLLTVCGVDEGRDELVKLGVMGTLGFNEIIGDINTFLVVMILPGALSWFLVNTDHQCPHL